MNPSEPVRKLAKIECMFGHPIQGRQHVFSGGDMVSAESEEGRSHPTFSVGGPCADTLAYICIAENISGHIRLLQVRHKYSMTSTV
jgi:hypothetical protein